MNQRQEFILKSLIRQTTPTDIDDLTSELVISLRTLREDVKAIQNFLNPINKKLTFDTKRKLLFLSADDKIDIQNYYIKYEESGDWLPTEESQRHLFLLYYLIKFNHHYLSIESIAETIFFSKTLLTKDLHKLNTWLEPMIGEKIIFSKSFGIKLDVEEEKIRKIIRASIHHYYYEDSKYLMHLFFYFAPQTGSKKMYHVIKETLTTQLADHQIWLDHDSLLTFMLEFIIVAQRISDGFILDKQPTLTVNQNLVDIFPFSIFEENHQKIVFNDIEQIYLIHSLEQQRFISENHYISYKNSIAETILMTIIDKLKQFNLIKQNISPLELYSWKSHLTHRLYEKELQRTDDAFPADLIKPIDFLSPLKPLITSTVYDKTGSQFLESDCYFQLLHLYQLDCLTLPPIRIILISNYSVSLTQRLKQKINTILPNYLYVSQMLTTDYLELLSDNSDRDLILATNTIYKQLNEPCCYISIDLNEQDQQLLQQFINDFYQSYLHKQLN